MLSNHYSCQRLIKFEFFRQIFEKYSTIKFHENLSSWRWIVPCGQRQACSCRSSQFYEHFKKTKHINEWMQDLVGEGKQLPLVGRLRMSGAAPLLPSLHAFMAWTGTVLPFQAYSHSLEKHLLVFVLSVCLCACISAASIDIFCEIRYWKLSMRICRENPNMIKMEEKILGSSHEDVIRFIVIRHTSALFL
jgi:hypothetical protein